MAATEAAVEDPQMELEVAVERPLVGNRLPKPALVPTLPAVVNKE